METDFLALRSDALSLEYKLKYGCATRDLDISDVVNNPVGAGLQQMGNSLQQMQPPPPTIRPPIHCNTINMGSGYSTTNCY